MSSEMSEAMRNGLRIGDRFDSKTATWICGATWQLRTGRYVVVRWQDECRSTHSETAVEYDASRSRAEWSRNISHEDRDE